MVRLRVMRKLEGIMRRPLEADPSDEVVKSNLNAIKKNS